MLSETSICRFISGLINWLTGHDLKEPLCSRAHREGWGHKIDKWLGKGHCKRVFEARQERLRKQ